MFKKELLTSYITTAVVATLVYSVPMIIFLKAADYNSTYLLFVGNFLFLGAVAMFVWSLNKRKGENASTQTMRAAGHVATIFGIIVSCIITLIALFIFVPDIFNSDQSGVVLKDAPSQTGTGETNGLVFLLFMNTIIGNFCGGSIASILIPITARKNQTKDSKSNVLNN